VLAGEDDPLALHPQRLAAAIPGASCTILAGDHLTVMRNPALAEAAVRFFNS
jgi:hypothetical protein